MSDEAKLRVLLAAALPCVRASLRRYRREQDGARRKGRADLVETNERKLADLETLEREICDELAEPSPRATERQRASTP